MDTKRLKQNFQEKKEQIFVAYQQKRQPHLFFYRHTRLIQEQLQTLWNHFLSDEPDLSLLALGGFGRGELYPYSDIDLAIASTIPLNTRQQENITYFIQALWDIGLHPAPISGSIPELLKAAKEELATDTAFLEAKFICGHTQTAEQLLQKLNEQRDLVQFIEAKILEQEQRHLKAHTSGSMLEPNIKTCPGGLRDIHTLLWLAQAQGLTPNFRALVTQKILFEQEARLLVFSHKQLAKLRIDLHLSAGRAQEFFIFDLQTIIASNWGLQDDEKQIKSEKLMQQLFQAIKAISQLNGILVPILRGRVSYPIPRITCDIDDYFLSIGNLLAIKDLALFKKNPAYILRAFLTLQRHPELNGIAPRTLRALWNERKKITHKFMLSAENKQLFLKLFYYENNLTHTLRYMHLYGILERFLPEFRPVTGLMQHDLFHIYPVDTHILAVLSNIRRLTVEAYSHELPKLSALMRNFPYRPVLYLAALFHDIAKGRKGSHSELGAVEAHKFAEKYHLPETETELFVWLVKEHLSFSYTAQKEDIHDPQVLNRFIKKIKNPTYLTALYILTVADIRGTNPKLWNSWRASLLQTLYESSYQQLKRPSETNLHASPVQNDSEAQLSGFTETEKRKLCHILGDTYFARYQFDEINWHLHYLIGHEEDKIAEIRMLEETQNYQMMIYVPDQPRLFASICQFISSLNLNIIEAKIYTTSLNFALDTFILQLPENTTTSLENRFLFLQQKIKQIFSFIGQSDKTLPTTRYSPSRRQRYFPIAPKVILIPEESEQQFSLEIITGDKQGLLAQVTAILSDFKIDILHAKISTLGERVEDRFVIQSAYLKDTKTQLALKNALLDVANNTTS